MGNRGYNTYIGAAITPIPEIPSSNIFHHPSVSAVSVEPHSHMDLLVLALWLIIQAHLLVQLH